MAASIVRRSFSVVDYTRMRETGILNEDDRVELLDGEIYLMSPIGPVHVALVNRLNKILMQHVGAITTVSVQNPIQLNDYSEPQPDIAVLRPREDDYSAALATPEDVVLLIEISDTSLEYDRDQKLPRYAASAIDEVWIVDVAAQTIEQYTHPLQGQYTHLTKTLWGNTITSQTIPAIQFTTDALFR